MSAKDDCWRNADLASAGGAASPRLLARFCTAGSTDFVLRSVAPSGSSVVDLSPTAVEASYGKRHVVWREASGMLKAAAPDGTASVTVDDVRALFL